MADKHLKILKAEINREIENLQNLGQEIKDIQDGLEDFPAKVELRAMGSILHDFYCAVERIFERIGKNIDEELPEGENWHIQLLERMAIPIPEVRKAVISIETLEILREMLAFRHIFRNVYGFELKWKRFKHLVHKLPEVLKTFEEDLKKFLSILTT